MEKLEMVVAIALLVVALRMICQGNIILAFVFMGFALFAMIHGGAADPEKNK